MKTVSSNLQKFFTIGLVLIPLLFIHWNVLTAQTIAINEIMASNAITIADEDGDYEDWIELYNFGSDPIFLEGFGLSDDFDNPFKWVFPAKTLQAGEFLLVWASGKNRTNPGLPLHTNFCISATGEEVLITHSSGSVIDEIQPIPIPTDISYGRQPDGTGEWFFFDEPTPDESNTTTVYSEILEPPVFSHPAGFYSQPFDLLISHSDPDVTILFTLDGSKPDISNLSGIKYNYKKQYPENPGDPFGALFSNSFQTNIYTDPIIITERSNEPDNLTHIATTWMFNPYHFPSEPVFKGTVVRAIALKEGAINSHPVTHSYFIDSNNEDPYSLSVISLSTNESLFFGYESGVYVAGIDFDNWRMNHPSDTATWRTPANYRRRGPEWEYPVHLEIFKNNESVFSQDMGFRIHGGSARTRPAKSFRFYARSIYGSSVFNYPLFANENYESYKRFLIRNSGQDWDRTLFRDAVIQYLVRHLNFDTQAYHPVVLFINGEYWGIHNLRERYDKHYLARVYHIDEDNLDFLSNHSIIIEGDSTHYNAMLDYLLGNDIALPEHYDYINTQMDIINFVDYQISQIYFSNNDWPHSNVDFWRLRTENYEPQSALGHDGRWRWLMYDMDAGLGLWSAIDFNSMEWATATEAGWHTFLLRRLLLNDTFKAYFITRFADLLNTSFLSERVISYINEFKSKTEPEISEHILRWNKPDSIEKWIFEVDRMINFAAHRPGYQRIHIEEFFNLEGQYAVELDVSNHIHGHIRVNTIDVKDGTPGINGNPYPWAGIYFKDIPIEVEAIPATGYAFSHWEGLPDGTPALTSINPEYDTKLKAHFVGSTEPHLIYFWVFDTNLANDTPFEQLNATYEVPGTGAIDFHSAMEGYPFEPEHPNWRKASMERRNAPTAINYRPIGNNDISYEESDMRGLQVKQPFTGDGGENTLVFHLPTSEYHKVVFRFAAKDEGAAENLTTDYSVNPGNDNWIAEDITSVHPLGEDYQLYEIDFTDIAAVNDNSDFKIRIRFDGPDMSADDGNRVSFNNFSLDGKLIAGTNLPPVVEIEIGFQQLIESGLNLEISLDSIFSDPDTDTLAFSAISMNTQCVSVSIIGQYLVVNPIQRGDAVITVLADDGYNDPVSTSFRVLVYPEAFKPGESDFLFTAWGPNEPEYSYPPHMLFLQSDVNDPGPYSPLLYPYYIPHDDYHSDDEATVGFPYNNTRRTRISGLGEDGISFINTGRGRDLGGALLAIDTRGIASAKINWLAGTILENSQKYGIRLQYRTEIEIPFSDLLVNGEFVEYITGADGEMMHFDSIALPPEVMDVEYLQLLWRYYHIEGDSGPRAELRLDDIFIGDATGISGIEKQLAHIYASGNSIIIELTDVSDAQVSVFDITGRLLLSRPLTNEGTHALRLDVKQGVCIVRLMFENQLLTRKVIIY